MAEVKIKDIQVLGGDHHPLKKLSFEIKKKDGSWQNQVRQLYDRGNAVAGLLYNKKERTVILTRQFRLASYMNGNSDGELVEACAGLLEKGEDPDEAMIREIKEETGYDISRIEKVYEAYTSPGALTELIFLYVAEYNKDQKTGNGGGLEEEQEELEVLEIPIDEALKMIERGEIRDVKTIILLQYLQIKQIL